MLTLDTVRAAVLSDQPWKRLDELVRAELANGRTTRQIYKSLMGMADEIDATPGLTEDGSDALGDALDALTGYCHTDCQYKDPPNTTLPSEEEIAKLPRWARVAFAARCARRVLPLPKHRRPETPDDHVGRFAYAIGVAEMCAGIAAADPDARSAYVALAKVSLQGAGSAIDALIAAGLAGTFETVDSGKLNAHVMIAVRSASGDAVPIADIHSVIRRDFDHLSSLAEWQQWDDDTPVPPEVFGPLWPEGPPKGWPAITDVPQRAELTIEAFARDRATEQMIEDDIVNLFNALNRYHIARSGVRLTLEQFQSLLPASVPAEV